MKLPVERRARLAAGLILALPALAGTATGASERRPAPPEVAPAPRGPAADYPVVLGAPFTIDGVTYTPVDRMNYDQVGYAALGSEGAGGVTLAHRTLPLPSYVEVTSLKTGRTILVRVERRGPMSGAALVELSPGAAAQLGVSDPREPVRVRRVNPAEAERALLRMGQRAPERMATPPSLVGVLLRKLEPAIAPAAQISAASAAPEAKPAAQAAAKVPASAMASPSAAKSETKLAAQVQPAAEKPLAAEVEVAATGPKMQAASRPARPSAVAGKGAVFVQVGTFSSAANAATAARQVGGSVSAAGKFHRVRIGGFASATEAGPALAKAKAAGYSDARIQRAD